MIGAYATFNGCLITDYADKDLECVGAVMAFSIAHEIAPMVVNWTYSGTPQSVYSVDLRLRNITQTTQPARTVDVCVILLGSN